MPKRQIAGRATRVLEAIEIMEELQAAAEFIEEETDEYDEILKLMYWLYRELE